MWVSTEYWECLVLRAQNPKSKRSSSKLKFWLLLISIANTQIASPAQKSQKSRNLRNLKSLKSTTNRRKSRFWPILSKSGQNQSKSVRTANVIPINSNQNSPNRKSNSEISEIIKNRQNRHFAGNCLWKSPKSRSDSWFRASATETRMKSTFQYLLIVM